MSGVNITLGRNHQIRFKIVHFTQITQNLEFVYFTCVTYYKKII